MVELTLDEFLNKLLDVCKNLEGNSIQLKDQADILRRPSFKGKAREFEAQLEFQAKGFEDSVQIIYSAFPELYKLMSEGKK